MLLEKMTLDSLPTPSLHLHTVQNKLEAGRLKREIKSVKKACLKVSIEEPRDDSSQVPPAELNRLSAYIDLQC